MLRQLDASHVHYAWDNRLAPRLEIDPGDSVSFSTRDASDGFYSWESTSADVPRRVWRGHPLTGPVWVRGAQPGDVLAIELLELTPGPLGFTSFSPGGGLLPAEFEAPFLKIWDLRNGRTAALREDIQIPIEPFLGVLGVASATPGEHPTLPPRRVGGNLDVRQLTAGATLYLPVEVDGALLSVGDGHAAQGDGEVCSSAIETSMTSTLRIGLRKDLRLRGPVFETARPLLPRTNTAGWFATTGIGPDLHEATREAVLAMLDYLEVTHRLRREEAYILSSVALDLKISEIVGAPNWVVSAFMPQSIFHS